MPSALSALPRRYSTSARALCKLILFGLVDQPLQLGPLCFGNRILIVLIKQGGYSRLRYRVQLEKTQLGFFQRNQFA